MSQVSSPTPSFFHHFTDYAVAEQVMTQEEQKQTTILTKARQQAQASRIARKKIIIEKQRARSEAAPLTPVPSNHPPVPCNPPVPPPSIQIPNVPTVDISKIPIPDSDDDGEDHKHKNPTLRDLDDVPSIPKHFIINVNEIPNEKKEEQEEEEDDTDNDEKHEKERRKQRKQKQRHKERKMRHERHKKEALSSSSSSNSDDSSVSSNKSVNSKNNDDNDELVRNQIKINEKADRFKKEQQKAIDGQIIATNQTNMIMLFLCGLAEQASQFPLFRKMVNFDGLSENVEAALKAKEFDKFIESVATNPKLAAFFQNPATGFGTTMLQICMSTHKSNVTTLKTKPTKEVRRDNRRSESPPVVAMPVAVAAPAVSIPVANGPLPQWAAFEQWPKDKLIEYSKQIQERLSSMEIKEEAPQEEVAIRRPRFQPPVNANLMGPLQNISSSSVSRAFGPAVSAYFDQK